MTAYDRTIYSKSNPCDQMVERTEGNLLGALGLNVTTRWGGSR